jgi:hypothetical protein
LQFWPLNDQITVSFVRAAGVLAKGRMFDMPAEEHLTACIADAAATSGQGQELFELARQSLLRRRWLFLLRSVTARFNIFYFCKP